MWDYIQTFDWSQAKTFLTYAGGSGGIGFWINSYRSRVRISVRLLRENLPDQARGETNIVIDVEIENLGRVPTSLRPEVRVTTWFYDQGDDAIRGRSMKRETVPLTINETDRSLAPFQPKKYTLTGYMPPKFVVGWFRTYRFKVTAGRGAAARFYAIGCGPVSAVRMWTSLALHNLTGRLPNVGPH